MAKTPRKHLGAQSELIACAWLLGQGFEVFRNVSPHGETDVLAIDETGKLWRFDIKTRSVENAPRITQEQADKGVLPLYVNLDGSCTIEHNPTPKFIGGREYLCDECTILFPRALERQRFCSSECRVLNLNKRRKAAGLSYATWIDNPNSKRIRKDT